MIANDQVRIRWEETPAPRLRVQAAVPGSGWADVCELAGPALRGARIFPTTHPVPNEEVGWTVERPDATTLRLTTAIQGRRLTRTLRLGASAARIHVSTAIELQGDELTEWVQDRWAFAQPAPLDFAWAPNLRPGPDLRIGVHTFRAPAVLTGKDRRWVALVPDLDTLAVFGQPHRSILDLNVRDDPTPVLAYGIERADPVFHVYYRHDPAMVLMLPEGRTTFAYDLLVGVDQGRPEALRTIAAYQWQRYAARYLAGPLPQTLPFRDYAAYAYPTLFEQEYVTFAVDGTPAGGFKALTAHKDYFRRPDPIVWNQVWFNGQRSAYGLWHYGQVMHRPDWQEAAVRMTALTLAAPQVDGLFPALYAYEDETWWGSIPRLHGGRRRIHTANAAWTATWLLWWSQDLHPNDAIERYTRRLADFLAEAQLPSGAIPAWFDLPEEAGAAPIPVETLRESAETGSAALFLGEISRATGEAVYREALLRAADFLIDAVLPEMKYWDFETFFSCSWKPLDLHDSYTGLLPHNTYSAYWTAHALLRAYELTDAPRYLQAARETMDVLNLYQQIWNPPFLSLYAFGGFGVMNTDGEWSDARQAVFAPLYLEFYRVTGDPEYFQRGVAALRASFALMAIPENEEVSPLTDDAYPTGLMPENFAHGGTDGTHGRSDSGWGAAGALAAAAWVERHYGGVYIDLNRNQAFGLDGCQVQMPDDEELRIRVAERLGKTREVTLVTSRGHRQTVTLPAHAVTTVIVNR